MNNDVDEVFVDERRTTHDGAVSPGLRALVRFMDDAIQIPGTNFRIGLDALIGLVPGLGDIAGGIMSSVVILAADKAGAPRSVIARMVGNAGIDMLFGAIPLLGDVFDAGWKANRRNLDLLERYLERPVETRRSSRLFVLGAIGLIILLVAASVTVAWLLTKALFESITR